MKIRKTNSSNRGTYTYFYEEEDGRTTKVVIRPGENGVTEADIKMLHSMDDSEVYYNLKNLRPERTEEEKNAIAEWKASFIKRETERRGYAPDEEEVQEAVNEAFPKNYNLSIDYEFGNEDTDQSENKMLIDPAALVDCEAESPVTARIRELMSQMTDKQRMALRLVWFDGMIRTDAAKIMGTTPQNVKKHYDKAIAFIETHYKL